MWNILLNSIVYLYVLGCCVSFLICIYMELKIYITCKTNSLEYVKIDSLDIIEMIIFIIRSWVSIYHWFKFEIFLEKLEKENRDERDDCKKD